MIDVVDRVQAALDEGEYDAVIWHTADSLVQALSRAGVVVIAKEDYDALVVRARDRRDTDLDGLRPTLIPELDEPVCPGCGQPLDPEYDCGCP